jgi:putative oxidoreductase
MKSVITRVAVHFVGEGDTQSRSGNIIVVFGRLCFSLIFIAAGLKHFSTAAIASASSQGVPFASIAVPFSGLMALAGGLSILLGYRARLGAWLIVLFLVPVTLTVHRFWGLADPVQSQLQLIMFMKNVSMVGGALIISQFGSGPVSLDARRSRSIDILEKSASTEYADHR